MMNKIELPKAHIQRIDFAVQHGLPLAANGWESVKLLHGGLSGACTYLIQVEDTPYVIKLEKLDDKDFVLDRYFSIIQLASRQGISPEVYFCDVAHGTILMQYIDAQPRPQATPESIHQIAAMVRQIHDGNAFPPWKTIFEILDHYYQKLNDSYKVASLIQQCRDESRQLEAILSDPADIRPSHCDLNPSNLLFDGDRLYFVDWQAASPQSFYFDLACCANWLYFYNEAFCQMLLQDYLQRVPSAQEREKLVYMRRFVSIYYGIGFVAIALQGDNMLPPLSHDEMTRLPNYLQFMQAIGAGQVNLAEPQIQQKFGYILMKTIQKDFTG